MNNLQTRFARELRTQMPDQGGIDFDCDHARRSLEQLLRERAASRADLDYEIFSGGTYRERDAFQNSGFNQEMLTESLSQLRLAPQTAARIEYDLLQSPGRLPGNRGRRELREKNQAFHIVCQFSAREIVILHLAVLVDQ